MVLAAIGAGNEMFAPVLDPAHRMGTLHGEPAQADLLRQQDAFVTEPAADVGSDDAHLALFEAETFRQSGAHDVRHLAGRVDRQLLEPRVPERDHAAPFDRRHALARGTDFARHLDRRVERPADIDIDERLEKHVVAPVLVNEHGVVLARVQHVVNGRQLLEIERDRRREVFRFRPCRSDAHRRQFADVAKLVGGERRLLRDLEPAQPGHRPDRLHADESRRGERGAALVGRDGNTAKPPMRDGAAHESDVLHSRQSNVGDELPTTAHQAVIFLSRDASSDTV